jgi:imidazolonepropionase-like amidohydrolase
MTSSPLLVMAAVCAAFSSTAVPVEAQEAQIRARDIAIVGAAVIDVAAGKAIAGQTIVVRGPRIVAMGPRATTTVPRGALVVDGAGKFLMPGLWDMHGHIFPRATKPADERAWQLPLYVATGVTGVRDMWTNLEDFAQVRGWDEAALAGRLIAPRIVPTGPMFDGPTGIFRNDAIVVADSADARRTVDSVARGGAHAVKIHNAIPRDAFFALAARAKERGLPLIGHVPGHVTVREALAAGQSDIEHSGASDGCDTEAAEAEAMRQRAGVGQRPAPGVIQQLLLDNHDDARCDDLMKELVRRRTWVTPTLVVARYMLIPDDSTITTRDELRFVPAAERAEWNARRDSTQRRRMPPALAATRRNVFRAQEKLVATMQRAGVSLMIGTDMANDWLVPGFSVHDELAAFVESGVSPAEALRAATLTPARYLRATDSLGSVAAGRVADLVLLDADPLADIRNTRRIRAVFTRGRYLDRAALDAVLSGAERGGGAARQSVRMVDQIHINDNRAPTGTLRAGVLTIHLEARDGVWHPDADSGLGVTVPAFAADGGPLEIPGPLVRVPVGTEIHASITNATTARGPLVLHGLNRRGSGGASADTISIGMGETRRRCCSTSRGCPSPSSGAIRRSTWRCARWPPGDRNSACDSVRLAASRSSDWTPGAGLPART